MHKTGGFLHIQRILKRDIKRARRDKECAPQQDEPTAEEMAEEEKQKQRRAKNREKVARCMERKKLKDAQEKEDAAHENDSAV